MELVVRRAEPADCEGIARTFADQSAYALRAGRYVDAHSMARIRPKG